MFCCCFFFFFFFQAEDGIRDVAVTGVQTCALPIFRARRAKRARHALEGGHRCHRLARAEVLPVLAGRTCAAHQGGGAPARAGRGAPVADRAGESGALLGRLPTRRRSLKTRIAPNSGGDVQGSVVNVVLILIVSLALWSMFKMADAELDGPGTMLVVGVVALAVVGTRRLLASRRERREAKHD